MHTCHSITALAIALGLAAAPAALAQTPPTIRHADKLALRQIPPKTSIVLPASTGVAPIISRCYQTLRNPYWTVKSAGCKIGAENPRLLSSTEFVIWWIRRNSGNSDRPASYGNFDRNKEKPL
jgi:hypothetical protein